MFAVDKENTKIRCSAIVCLIIQMIRRKKVNLYLRTKGDDSGGCFSKRGGCGAARNRQKLWIWSLRELLMYQLWHSRCQWSLEDDGICHGLLSFMSRFISSKCYVTAKTFSTPANDDDELQDGNIKRASHESAVCANLELERLITQHVVGLHADNHRFCHIQSCHGIALLIFLVHNQQRRVC